MDDYIRRQTARAEILSAHTDGRIAAIGDVLDVLDLVPATDVKPVRHRRWTDSGVCSLCGAPCLRNEIGEAALSPYCPHCGAKMDRE